MFCRKSIGSHWQFKVTIPRPSLISGGGDGLFLRLDCQANTVVAFYNGVIVPAADDDSHETWEECSYRIFISEDSNQRMDIPVNCRSTDVYCGTSNLYRVPGVVSDYTFR